MDNFKIIIIMAINAITFLIIIKLINDKIINKVIMPENLKLKI